jgi:hypothetical protein
MTAQTFATAKTKAKPNGAAGEILALKADVYNAIEAMKEQHAAHESRVSERLDAIDHKLSTCLKILELLGTQAGMLAGK